MYTACKSKDFVRATEVPTTKEKAKDCTDRTLPIYYFLPIYLHKPPQSEAETSGLPPGDLLQYSHQLHQPQLPV